MQFVFDQPLTILPRCEARVERKSTRMLKPTAWRNEMQKMPAESKLRLSEGKSAECRGVGV